MVVQVAPQGLAIRRPVGGVAQAVEQQRDLAQAEALQEPVAERDHVDVGLRVVAAEQLHADLAELAVAAGLGPLVAELRAFVPDLPGGDGPVLGVGPAHGGSQLGAQGELLRRVALVEEVEHLLLHDVGGLAEPAEDAQILEDRRHQQAEAGRRCHLRETVDQRPLARRGGPEDVSGALWGCEVGARHDRSGYARPSQAMRCRSKQSRPAASPDVAVQDIGKGCVRTSEVTWATRMAWKLGCSAVGPEAVVGFRSEAEVRAYLAAKASEPASTAEPVVAGTAERLAATGVHGMTLRDDARRRADSAIDQPGLVAAPSCEASGRAGDANGLALPADGSAGGQGRQAGGAAGAADDSTGGRAAGGWGCRNETVTPPQ